MFVDMQKVIDAISAASREERSKYHLTLGGAIDLLEKLNADLPVCCSDDGSAPGKPHSYRGYYSDLAFAISESPVNVSDFLAECRSSLHATMGGYKGGDYVMSKDVPLWVSEYGSASGRAVMDIMAADGKAVLLIKQVD